MEKAVVKKGRVKVGIYLCAILMMGAIAVSSNLSNIMAAFPEVSQTTVVAYVVSIPCLLVIPTTIITGRLMGSIAKKTLMIIGVILWLIGGVVPFCMDNLNLILVMRMIFGVGLGIVSSVCAALVAENFEDVAERDKVMGTMMSFEMLGAITFALVSGNLGTIGWNVAFLIHLVAIISLIAAIVCIPYKKPEKVTRTGEKIKFKPTGMMWVWVIAFFVYMVAGQSYSNSASTIITELNLGGSAAAGYSLAIFAVGGLIMGFVFGRIAKACKRMTLTVGCVILAGAYLIMAFAQNLAISYLGAFICGLAFSICQPCLLSGSANSVEQSSSDMAVSIASSLQNAGMSICPYIVTPAGAALAAASGSKLIPSQGVLLFACILVIILAVVFSVINTRGKKTA